MFGWAAIAALVTSAILGTASLHGSPSHTEIGDGGTNTDADNTCTPHEEPSLFAERGETYHGYLLPGADPSDHFGFRVPVNADILIEMDPGPAIAAGFGAFPDFDLRLKNESCITISISEHPGNGNETIAKSLTAAPYYVMEIYIPGTPAARSAAPGLSCHPFCVPMGAIGYIFRILPPNG